MEPRIGSMRFQLGLQTFDGWNAKGGGEGCEQMTAGLTVVRAARARVVEGLRRRYLCGTRFVAYSRAA